LLAGVTAGVEGDGLNRLSRFEVAGVVLRIRHLLGEALLGVVLPLQLDSG
jgi:hypothetical protein